MQKRLLRALAVIATAAALFIALPQASASADVCNPGEIYCMPDVELQLQQMDSCKDLSNGNVFGAFAPTTCESSRGGNAPLPGKQGFYIPVISDVLKKMTQMAQSDAQMMLTFILVDQLSGHNVTLNPVLVCSDTQNAVHEACAGKQEWFLGQYKLMRNISLYVVIPLFFIMVIQSILKGSLYNLLRNSLVMLPLALLGTTVVIVFMQMFLNITDDFCNYIVDRATTGLQVSTCMTSDGQVISSTTCGLKNSLAERSLGSSGMFVAFVWFFILMAACLAIYLELIGRQIGVYMMALLLPLVMAGLVWPRTVGIAKKVFQYELALIISKVFIVAALSLGMGAFAHSGTTTCTNGANGNAASGTTCDDPAAAAGSTQATNQSWQAIASGTLIILLAAFAGAKVVTLSPAAMAGQAPVWNKGAIASRGQVISVIGQRVGQVQRWRAKNRKPGDNFKNNAKAGTDSSGSGDAGVLTKKKKGGSKAPGPPGSGEGSSGKGGGSGDLAPDPPDSDGGGGEKAKKKSTGRDAMQKKCENFANSMDKFADKLENMDSTPMGRAVSLGGAFRSNWKKASEDEMRRKANRRHFSSLLANGGDTMNPNYADSTTAEEANKRAAFNEKGPAKY